MAGGEVSRQVAAAAMPDDESRVGRFVGTAPRSASLVPRREARFAWIISDGFEPRNWMLLLAPLLGWRAAGLTGVGWGLFAALFTAVLPTLLLKFGVRRRYWGDQHVRRRQDRLVAAPAVLASVVSGTALLYGLGAPDVVSNLVAAMLAVLLVLLVITFFWKVSVHSAVATGSIAILTSVEGLWGLSLAPLVALIGWSRVRLRCHTVGQVAVGALVGATVASCVFGLLQ